MRCWLAIFRLVMSRTKRRSRRRSAPARSHPHHEFSHLSCTTNENLLSLQDFLSCTTSSDLRDTITKLFSHGTGTLISSQEFLFRISELIPDPTQEQLETFYLALSPRTCTSPHHRRPPSLMMSLNNSPDDSSSSSSSSSITTKSRRVHNTFTQILLQSREFVHGETLLPISSSTSLLSSHSNSASCFETKRRSFSSSSSSSWCRRVDSLTRNLSGGDSIHEKNLKSKALSLRSVIDVYLEDDDYVDDDCAVPRRSKCLRRQTLGFDDELCSEV